MAGASETAARSWHGAESSPGRERARSQHSIDVQDTRAFVQAAVLDTLSDGLSIGYGELRGVEGSPGP